MRCPRCGSPEHSDHKKPATVADSVYRRHRCKSCGWMFLSVQSVVTDAERLLNDSSSGMPAREDTWTPEAAA